MKTNEDTPCSVCGTNQIPVWYTDNVFWNAVVREEKYGSETEGFMCPLCFIEKAEAKFDVTGWRLIPDWAWRSYPEGITNWAYRIGPETDQGEYIMTKNTNEE